MAKYIVLFLVSVFLASISQVLLKKAALRSYDSVIKQYLNWQVILGYGIFIICTFITMMAYRYIPLNLGPVLETTGYIYVTIFGVLIFKEKLSLKKICALAIIIAGILIYTL